MQKDIFTVLCIFLCTHINAQTTFSSPGLQSCTTTNTELPAVMASDGVTIKPYLWLDQSCLSTDLKTISVNDCSSFPWPLLYSACSTDPAYLRKPTFCYNNTYFPSSAGNPLAIARNSTTNTPCEGARSNVVADFSTTETRPQGLTFTVNDIDNPYDSIEVKVYSNGTLVPFTFALADPVNTFVQTTNTGTVTVANFNGGKDGVWGESSSTVDYNKGAIFFTVDPVYYVDSVVLTQIIRSTRTNQNPAISIGEFKWQSNIVLPVVFGNIHAAYSNNYLTVNWNTQSERNNDYFEVQISQNGKEFKTIGIVKSKAVNNNSDTPISYNYSTNDTYSFAYVGVGLLLIIVSALLSKKNKWAGGLTIALIFICSAIACTKNGNHNISDKKDLFIRIKQVDVDGKSSLSKVIKVAHQ